MTIRSLMCCLSRPAYTLNIYIILTGHLYTHFIGNFNRADLWWGSRKLDSYDTSFILASH